MFIWEEKWKKVNEIKLNRLTYVTLNKIRINALVKIKGKKCSKVILACWWEIGVLKRIPNYWREWLAVENVSWVCKRVLD